MASDIDTPRDHGILHPGLILESGNLICVFVKAERIGGLQRCFCLYEAIRVGQQVDAVLCAHQEVMIAMGADLITLLEIQGVNQFPAVRALGPEVIRNRILLLVASTEFWLVKDTHSSERDG